MKVNIWNSCKQTQGLSSIHRLTNYHSYLKLSNIKVAILNLPIFEKLKPRLRLTWIQQLKKTQLLILVISQRCKRKWEVVIETSGETVMT